MPKTSSKTSERMKDMRPTPHPTSRALFVLEPVSVMTWRILSIKRTGLTASIGENRTSLRASCPCKSMALSLSLDAVDEVVVTAVWE
eukprot:14367_3